ncbi:hypothetical protein [Rufibacter tibetensis]|uniref:Uncharacterized protein n=1 Tax=Rufibacter tibetensis TaxID=512763 RepID=A0A0N7HWH0_9BACT|nr:hypothetical protein [Rufibacter tibetensis]ALI99224.1 hypothetical protein DC20_09845 [Rufibacter tibetensis]
MKHTLLIIFLCALVTLVLGASQPASAQTAYTSSGQQKRELRKHLRAAKKMETDFSESHLNVEAYSHRKGESGRKLKKDRKRNQLGIREDGTAVIKPQVFSKKNAFSRTKKK